MQTMTGSVHTPQGMVLFTFTPAPTAEQYNQLCGVIAEAACAVDLVVMLQSFANASGLRLQARMPDGEMIAR